jgi:hypothetical protein
MEMKVKYRLPGNLAIVGEKIIAFKMQTLNQCLCYNIRGMQNGMICLRRQIQEIPAMLFGKDQGMAKMNWINIKKRDNMIVLK